MSFKQTILLIVTLIALLSNFYLLHLFSTTQAIRSPWDVIPLPLITGYGVLTFLLLVIGYTFQKIPWWGYALLILFSFLSFSVLLIIFPIGFGFDPFIHQTTEQIIHKTGIITPKPLYYIGQYSLVLFFSTLSNLSLSFIDTFLTPFLSMLIFPCFIPLVLRTMKKDCSVFSTWISVFAFILLPLSFLTFNTPQHVSFFFALLILLLGILYIHRTIPFWILGLLNIAQIFIHPLSGIPISIFLVLLFLSQQKWKYKSLLMTIIILLASQITVWMFFVQSRLSSNLGTWINFREFFSWDAYIQLIKIPVFYFVNTHYFFLDFISLYAQNTSFWVCFCALILFLLYPKIRKTYYIYPLMTIILVCNFAFLSVAVSFEQLIFYEQSDYAHRILTMGFFFLIPFFLFFVADLFDRIRKTKQKNLLLSCLIILSIFISISWYVRYPRHDNFVLHRGFNISKEDIQTAHLIHNDCPDCSYVVASSQATATAALKAFGFKTYFDTQFYYPLPTSSDLYTLYLDLVYSPQTMKDTVQKIFQLSPEIDTVYFTINDYWWEKEKIIPLAIQTFDSYVNLNNSVYIFKIQRIDN